jgi:hypothetical protein
MGPTPKGLWLEEGQIGLFHTVVLRRAELSPLIAKELLKFMEHISDF